MDMIYTRLEKNKMEASRGAHFEKPNEATPKK
jgi:hypothetical protein